MITFDSSLALAPASSLAKRSWYVPQVVAAEHDSTLAFGRCSSCSLQNTSASQSEDCGLTLRASIFHIVIFTCFPCIPRSSTKPHRNEINHDMHLTNALFNHGTILI